MSRLERVLEIGFRFKESKRNVPAVDAEMQDLLNAGLSGYMIQIVMETTDPQSFLAAVDALRTRERVSAQATEALWNAAAVRFFDTPPRDATNRQAFVRVMDARYMELPSAWRTVLYKHLDADGISKFVRRALNGDTHFWVKDDAALVASLMFAIFLVATTARGAVKLALKMQLAAAVGALETTTRGDASALKTLADSLENSVYAVDLDTFVDTIVRNLGDVSHPDMRLPAFESALDAAENGDTWRGFFNNTMSFSSQHIRVYYGDPRQPWV